MKDQRLSWGDTVGLCSGCCAAGAGFASSGDVAFILAGALVGSFVGSLFVWRFNKKRAR